MLNSAKIKSDTFQAIIKQKIRSIINLFLKLIIIQTFEDILRHNFSTFAWHLVRWAFK